MGQGTDEMIRPVIYLTMAEGDGDAGDAGDNPADARAEGAEALHPNKPGQSDADAAAEKAAADKATADAAATAAKDGDKTGKDGGESKDQEPAGAPEAYTFKAPNGVDLAGPATEAAEPVFRELGLPQAAVDKLLALQNELEVQREDAWRETVKGWEQEVREHPKIGGENFDGTIRLGNLVLGKFGPPGFVDLIVKSGHASHPLMLEFMRNIGTAVGEDALLGTGARGASQDDEKTPEEVFYGSK